MKNPWTRQRLEEEFIGQEESQRLEFKSSRELAHESAGKVSAFVDDLSTHVGAFLNSDGGLLIVGIEEADKRDKKRADLAERLSEGVPRSRMTASRLSSMLCDRISPAVTSLLQVHAVKTGEHDGEDLLAFVVEVRPGVTAYQSADKKYYGRRSFSSNPLEDKEIRLRMLADERPRATITIVAEAVPSSNSWQGLERAWSEYWDKVAAAQAAQSAAPPTGFSSVDDITPDGLLERMERFVFTRPSVQYHGRLFVSVQLRNVGVVTIRRCALESSFEGDPPRGFRPPFEGLRQLREVRFDVEDQIPLYPDRQERVGSWAFEFDRGAVGHSDLPWNLNVTIFLDGGLAVRESIDLVAALQGAYAAFEDRLRSLEEPPHAPGPAPQS